MPTPNYSLHIPTNSELPHKFNSETLFPLDTLIGMVLQSINQQTPPVSPSAGDAYHVASGAPATTWEGQSGVIAVWTGGAWTFSALRVGTKAYIVSLGQIRMYSDDGLGLITWRSSAVTHNLQFEIPAPTGSNAAFLNEYALYFNSPNILSVRAKCYGVGIEELTLTLVTHSNALIHSGAFSTQITNPLRLTAATNNAHIAGVVTPSPPNGQWVVANISNVVGTPELLTIEVLVDASF